jgi:hypothetical protein
VKEARIAGIGLVYRLTWDEMVERNVGLILGVEGGSVILE